jgi:hypothetical protein
LRSLDVKFIGALSATSQAQQQLQYLPATLLDVQPCKEKLLVLSNALVVNRHSTSLPSPYHLPAKAPVPLPSLHKTDPIAQEYPWTSNAQVLVYTQKKERLHNANDRSNDGYGYDNE